MKQTRGPLMVRKGNCFPLSCPSGRRHATCGAESTFPARSSGLPWSEPKMQLLLHLVLSGGCWAQDPQMGQQSWPSALESTLSVKVAKADSVSPTTPSASCLASKGTQQTPIATSWPGAAETTESAEHEKDTPPELYYIMIGNPGAGATPLPLSVAQALLKRPPKKVRPMSWEVWIDFFIPVFCHAVLCAKARAHS